MRSPAGVIALAALCVALAVGGSQQVPMHTMIVELAAAIALPFALAGPRAVDDPAPRAAWFASALVLLVLAAETIPLPYDRWASLPGRTLAAGARAVAGIPPGEQSLSLDPYATVGDVLAILPGLALFAAGLAADRAMIRLLTGCVVAAALVSALLGALQVAANPDLYFYAETHRSYAVGLFANHNHQADLLLVGMLLAVALAHGWRESIVMGAVVAVLLGGVLAAGSRAGLVLLAPVLIGVIALTRVDRRGRGGRRLLVAVAIIAVLVAIVAFSPVAGRLLARYRTAGDDLRFAFWPNTLYAAWLYWPFGSGLGTFVPAYQAIEPLDTLTPAIANHAHNDYLELLLELGLGGVVMIAAYVVALAAAAIRGVRRDAGLCRLHGAALLAIIVLLAHSAVDYPLRTPALMAVFGLMNGIVFRRVRSNRQATARPRAS